jgi:excisionase family DNA binding protein
MTATRRPLTDLATHPEAFVTVAQLADYWQISRKQVLKLIESGSLDAIQLGAKTYRIRASAALAFERRGRKAHGRAG